MAEGADHGLAPARVRRQLESSLGRLGVERVDMFLTHEWDPDVPVAETAGVLDELVAEGKVGAYGLSNVGGAGVARRAGGRLLRLGAELVLAARPRRGGGGAAALRRAWARLHAVQPALRRLVDRQVPPRRGGAGGLADDACVPSRTERLRTDAVFDALEALAERGDPAQLALAWLYADPRVTAVVVGPRRPEHLAPALAALAMPLAPGEREAIGALFP